MCKRASAEVLVAGAGGFIGGWLAGDLIRKGVRVRCVDLKSADEWYQRHPDAENLQLDLRVADDCWTAVSGVSQVYNLASDMGGMGFIEAHKAECMLSVLINTQLLVACRNASVAEFFFASSACVYNVEKQLESNVAGLREEDAYPAMPEDGYGWEKLFGERMCRHFREDFGLKTRVARYHNVYGPYGAWKGGREKAPAAICRKIIEAKLSGKHEIEIWGDGEQTRSFLFIDDCIYGTQALMNSSMSEPVNLGSARLVSINQLVDMIEQIAGVELQRRYKPDAPRGVRGRNSDNTLIKRVLGWEPSVGLERGLEETYRWIHDQITGVDIGIRSNGTNDSETEILTLSPMERTVKEGLNPQGQPTR